MGVSQQLKINQYVVYCKNRYNSNDVKMLPVVAPSKQWIRVNWFSLVGTNVYTISRIDLVGKVG